MKRILNVIKSFTNKNITGDTIEKLFEQIVERIRTLKYLYSEI